MASDFCPVKKNKLLGAEVPVRAEYENLSQINRMTHGECGKFNWERLLLQHVARGMWQVELGKIVAAACCMKKVAS